MGKVRGDCWEVERFKLNSMTLFGRQSSSSVKYIYLYIPFLWESGTLRVWRVHANILNEQLRTAYKGWSFSVDVGEG